MTQIRSLPPRPGRHHLSWDVSSIPVDCDWEAADHPRQDAFYVWGPTPMADFIVNHETAQEAAK